MSLFTISSYPWVLLYGLRQQIKYQICLPIFLSNFFIITVPTPLIKKTVPDLKALKKAFSNISKYIKKGDIIIVESTVYPGVTRDLAQFGSSLCAWLPAVSPTLFGLRKWKESLVYGIVYGFRSIDWWTQKQLPEPLDLNEVREIRKITIIWRGRQLSL